MSKREIHIFHDSSKLIDFAVDKWETLSIDTTIRDKPFKVAVSGGKTPVELYKHLSNCKRDLDWDKTHIFQVDERFVPREDKDNNFKMLDKCLIKPLNLRKKNIYPIPTNFKTAAESAKEYEHLLTSFFKKTIPVFDLILLGMGEDGHTASIFPEPVKTLHKGLFVNAVEKDSIKYQRITLKMEIINNAKNILFLVTGKNKADIAKEVIEKKNRSFPAAKIYPKTGKILFLIDNEAGSRLEK